MSASDTATQAQLDISLEFTPNPNTLKYVLEGVLALVLVISGMAIYVLLKKFKFKVGHLFKKLHLLSFFKNDFPSGS